MPLTKKINLQTTDNKELNTGADWALAGNCFDESEIVKNISEGMAFIMDGAYKNCRSLTKVIVPFGITDICEEAFMNCGSLRVTLFNCYLTTSFSLSQILTIAYVSSSQYFSRSCRALVCSSGGISLIFGKIVMASLPLWTPSRL